MYLKRENTLIILLLFVVFGVLFAPVFVTAQINPPEPDPSKGIVNPLKFDTLGGFVKEIVTVARNIGMLVAVFSIVYAGFLKVTALGNEEKLKKANKAFLWSVIGTAVLLGSWLIATAIQGTVRELEAPAGSWHNVDETWIA